MSKPAPLQTPPPAPHLQDGPAPPESFTPESFVMPGESEDDIGKPVVISTPAPKAPIVPKEPSPGPTPPPVQKTKKEENADIRKQLELANERARQAEEKAAQAERERQERVAALERERDELNGRHTEVATKFAELNRMVSMEDPLKSEEVQSVLRPWNERVDSLAKDISDTKGNGQQFRSMLPELVKTYRGIGDEGSEGYENRRDAYNNLVNQFPEHAREIRELVRNGIEIQGKAQQVIREMQSNGDTWRYSRERKQFDALVQDFAKDEARFFNPAPEVKESDPYNTEVLVTELLGSSDDGKKRMDQIKKFTKFVSLPLAPVDPAELAKMTSEQAASFLEGRLKQYQENQVKMRRLMPAALASHALLPGLVKRNQELEQELATLRGVAPPPKPGGSNGNQEFIEESDGDPRHFVPTNKVMEDFKNNG